MGQGRRPLNGRISLGLAASAVAMLLIPAAAEARKAPLDAQLLAPPQVKGKKVTAPVLVSQRTAKKLKLGSPVAVFVTKSAKKLRAPNPLGPGRVQIRARTLRAGDELRGRAKLKGKPDKLLPKVKGMNFKVKSRESAFSVDELTAAVVALAGQLNALSLRMDELEKSMLSELAKLRAELEALALKFPELQAQIDEILAKLDALESGLADLQTQIDALTGTVTGLESDMAAVQTTISGLQGDVASLQTDLATLEGTVGTLSTDLDKVESDLATLDTRVTALESDVAALCAAMAVC